MERDCLKKYDIKVVIISRGRSTTISTHKLLPDWVEVLVPESEKELYEQAIKNPIITIPDEYEGLGPVRNWCLDNFKENTVIMIDDDVHIVYCVTGKLNRRIEDAEELMQILINTAVMAQDLGVHCFGFAQTDIRKYKGCNPFDLCTWVGCVMGVIGRDYRFKNDKFKVDIDFCLQNILVDRIIWQDCRYYWSQNRDNNIGGNSKFRTADGYKKSLDSLTKKWGQYIKVTWHKNQPRISLNVKRRQPIQYE